MASTYALARLSSAQETLLRESEATLGGGILLAYSASDGSGAATLPTGLRYSDLTASQVECLEGLERQLDLVILAVRPV